MSNHSLTPFGMANKKGRHSDEEIRNRRDEIMLLQSKGFTINQIADELGLSRQTIGSDIKYINKKANEETNMMAKESLNAMYQSGIRSINNLKIYCWDILNKEDDDRHWHPFHKIQAVRLLKDLEDSRVNMINTGPLIMNMNRLESEIDELKRGIKIGV
jgi:hypothetical protein